MYKFKKTGTSYDLYLQINNSGSQVMNFPHRLGYKANSRTSPIIVPKNNYKRQCMNLVSNEKNYLFRKLFHSSSIITVYIHIHTFIYALKLDYNF